MKNRIRGRVTDESNDMGVFASPCRFSWPFMMGQQNRTHSTREIFVGSLRKTFGHLSDRAKKIKIDKTFTLEHSPNKVFRYKAKSNPRGGREPGDGHLWPVSPRHCPLHYSESGGISACELADSFVSFKLGKTKLSKQ